jgi:predicted aconitase
MTLTKHEQSVLDGVDGPAAAVCMRVVVEMAGLLGAPRLIEISSAHIDGCLYHGDGGVEFAQRLVENGARVAVPTTLNVGALDLLNPSRVNADPHSYKMARRQMAAYEAMGCAPTWTCAPYQAGHRPKLGEHVAWGESNAVAFANSVLGARTNRYGDFMDICCALVARAPYVGLHTDVERLATVVIDTSAVSERLKSADVFFPVLGSWLGRTAGGRIAVIDGLPPSTGEDQLKALGAAAATTGAVGLFHVAGVTPEAHTVDAALGGCQPESVIRLTPEAVRVARDELSTVPGESIDAVALGSPHFSLEEFAQLEELLPDRRFEIPFYVCTGRGVLEQLDAEGRTGSLVDVGVEIVVDTCVVVTPILPSTGGTLMTNSGKFALYTPPNIGYEVVYGSLEDCVASASTGRVERDEAVWG